MYCKTKHNTVYVHWFTEKFMHYTYTVIKAHRIWKLFFPLHFAHQLQQTLSTNYRLEEPEPITQILYGAKERVRL